jgi:glycosyltransferase involved in cell wall biosynthesis
MTQRLVLASLAVDYHMGQQVFEDELARRAPEELGSGWDVRRVTTRTLRSTTPGTDRVPAWVLHGAPPWVRRSAGRVLYRGADVVHRLDLRLPPAAGEVLTVLDVSAWRFPDEAPLPSDTAEAAGRARFVICPSEFSASEVAGQLGLADVVAIPLGVAPAFFERRPATEERLAELGIRAPFVLHAGGCSLRKNLAGLADAWTRVRASRPEASLVLVGPADGRRDRLFAGLPGTVRTGRLEDADVRGVMAAAAVVVVPSLYEGFGLPALEGMASGVPVVAADRSALPEVCGDAALLVEPTGDALAEGILAVLEGDPGSEGRVARGIDRAGEFTWGATVRAHAELWRRAGGG